MIFLQQEGAFIATLGSDSFTMQCFTMQSTKTCLHLHTTHSFAIICATCASSYKLQTDKYLQNSNSTGVENLSRFVGRCSDFCASWTFQFKVTCTSGSIYTTTVWKSIKIFYMQHRQAHINRVSTVFSQANIPILERKTFDINTFFDNRPPL